MEALSPRLAGGAGVSGGFGIKEWENVQQKTFTRWVNTFLKTRELEVKDLATDLADGLMLINLLEILTNKTIAKYNKAPKMQVQKMENLAACFTLLSEEGVKLVNVGATDIESGNLKIILGLIWTLILHFQMAHTRVQTGDSHGAPSAGSTSQILLSYVRRKCESQGAFVETFADGFRDGKAISVLVNSLSDEKELIDVKNLGPPELAVEHAMLVAEKEFGIPRVMDAADMVNRPDARSIMTYISYFHQKEQQLQEERAAREKLLKIDPSKTTVTAELDTEPSAGADLSKAFAGHVRSARLTLFSVEGQPAISRIARAAVITSTVTSASGTSSSSVVSDVSAVDGAVNEFKVRFIAPTVGDYTWDLRVDGASVPGFPVTVHADKFETAPDAGAVKQAQSQTALLFAVDTAHAITQWNDAVAALSQVPASSALGSAATQHVASFASHDEDSKELSALLQSVMGAHAESGIKTSATSTAYLRQSSGTKVPIVLTASTKFGAKGELEGAWCVAQSIASVPGYAAAASTPLFRVDADNNIVFANETALKLLNKPASEVVGHAFLTAAVKADASAGADGAASEADHIRNSFQQVRDGSPGSYFPALCSLSANSEHSLSGLILPPTVVSSPSGPLLEVAVAEVSDLHRGFQRELLGMRDAMAAKDSAHVYEVQAARDDAIAESAAQTESLQQQIDKLTRANERLQKQSEQEQIKRIQAERDLENYKSMNEQGEEAKTKLLEQVRSAEQKNHMLVSKLEAVGVDMKAIEDRCAELEARLAEMTRKHAAEIATQQAAVQEAKAEAEAAVAALSPRGSLTRPISALRAPSDTPMRRTSAWEQLDSLIKDLKQGNGIERIAEEKGNEDPMAGMLSPRLRPTAIQLTAAQMLQAYLDRVGPLQVTFTPAGVQNAYWFGSRKVHLVVVNGKLQVRVGGGFSTIEDFVAKNTPAEAAKLSSQLHEQGRQQQAKGDGYTSVSVQNKFMNRPPSSRKLV